MNYEYTVAIVKPGFLGHLGSILKRAEDKDLSVIDLSLDTYSPATWKWFYSEHEGKPFYNGLIEYMSAGPVVVALLLGPSAVSVWRELMGPTTANYRTGHEGTIRGDFGGELPCNVVHGSDSTDAADREAEIFNLRKLG